MLVIPLVILGFCLAQAIGPAVGAACFHGNYKQWVFDAFGQQFQRNVAAKSLVVSAVNLSHAAGAKPRYDLIGAESCSVLEVHYRGMAQLFSFPNRCVRQ